MTSLGQASSNIGGAAKHGGVGLLTWQIAEGAKSRSMQVEAFQVMKWGPIDHVREPKELTYRGGRQSRRCSVERGTQSSNSSVTERIIVTARAEEKKVMCGLLVPLRLAHPPLYPHRLRPPFDFNHRRWSPRRNGARANAEPASPRLTPARVPHQVLLGHGNICAMNYSLAGSQLARRVETPISGF